MIVRVPNQAGDEMAVLARAVPVVRAADVDLLIEFAGADNGNRYGNPVIQRRRHPCVVSASGGARHADALGIDFLPRQQVLDRALRFVFREALLGDPGEQGRRAALNLGHTIGHGLETTSKFELLHGEAIAIGTIAEARVAERIGLAKAGVADRIERVTERVNLPTRFAGLDIEEIVTVMQADKKKKGGRLKYALPRDIGDVVIGASVKDDVLVEVLNEMKESA